MLSAHFLYAFVCHTKPSLYLNSPSALATAAAAARRSSLAARWAPFASLATSLACDAASSRTAEECARPANTSPTVAYVWESGPQKRLQGASGRGRAGGSVCIRIRTRPNLWS